MLEYFTYKKFKKHRDEKREKEEHDVQEEVPAPPSALDNALQGSNNQVLVKHDVEDTDNVADSANPKSPQPAEPVLSDDDERFLERITSESSYADEDGRRPPLPPRVKTPDISLDSDDESQRVVDNAAEAGKEAGKEMAGKTDKKANRFSFFRRKSKSKKGPAAEGAEPERLAVPEPEAEREKDDITKVLDDLNLAASNNKTFSLSEESSELVRQFTVVLKDLVNGVPTAARDLQNLLQDHDGVLSRQYEKLPKSMKKLVTQLPSKLTGSLAPELLAVAAESQGLAHDTSSKVGIKATAKSLLKPKNLQELVTKPGAVVGMLKAIVNALKVRWPAFMGTNVIWSIALFLLLFVLWYCHKRGRETRLEQEKAAEDGDRVEELPDDPALPEAGTATSPPIATATESGPASSGVKLPPPPIGVYAPDATSPEVKVE